MIETISQQTSEEESETRKKETIFSTLSALTMVGIGTALFLTICPPAGLALITVGVIALGISVWQATHHAEEESIQTNTHDTSLIIDNEDHDRDHTDRVDSSCRITNSRKIKPPQHPPGSSIKPARRHYTEEEIRVMMSCAEHLVPYLKQSPNHWIEPREWVLLELLSWLESEHLIRGPIPWKHCIHLVRFHLPETIVVSAINTRRSKETRERERECAAYVAELKKQQYQNGNRSSSYRKRKDSIHSPEKYEEMPALGCMPEHLYDHDTEIPSNNKSRIQQLTSFLGGLFRPKRSKSNHCSVRFDDQNNERFIYIPESHHADSTMSLIQNPDKKQGPTARIYKMLGAHIKKHIRHTEEAMHMMRKAVLALWEDHENPSKKINKHKHKMSVETLRGALQWLDQLRQASKHLDMHDLTPEECEEVYYILSMYEEEKNALVTRCEQSMNISLSD